MSNRYAWKPRAQTEDKTMAINIIEMTRDKDCKHSVVYRTDAANAPITSVYLMKTFSDPMPPKITVTVVAGGGGGSKKSKKKEVAAEGE